MNPMPSAPGVPVRRLFILFFLALNFLYMVTSSGRVRTTDEVTVDLQTESLATHGSFAIPQAVSENLFYGKVDRFGQAQAPYGAAQAVLVLPWYFTGRLLRAIVPGIPMIARDAFLDAVLVTSSATFAALAAALAFLVFLRLDIPVRPALGAAFLVALATPLFSYSSWFFSEPLAAALFMAAALFLFTGEPGQEIDPLNLLWAALCLGVALWVRPMHVLAAAVFIAAIIYRNPKKAVRSALFVALVIVFFGGAYLVRNKYLFGNPLDFGYPAAADGAQALNSFHTPLLHGLFGFLLSPGKSIFIFAPPILMAIFGIRRLARRDRGLAFVSTVMPIAYLLFFARYTQWEGGYCFGPRYLVPTIPLLCLGLGPVLGNASPHAKSWARRAAVVLFIAGVLVQVSGMATSFLEDEVNKGYYNQNYDYRMSYDPVVSQTRLLFQYISSPVPAPVGLGLDRWFVFLAKLGVSHATVLSIWGLEWLGLILVTWQFEGILARLRDKSPPVL